MSENIINQNEPAKSNVVDLPECSVSTIDLNKLTPNSILIIKIDVDTDENKSMRAPTFLKLLSPYAAILMEKKITIILMKNTESIETADPEQMESCGWTKVDKSPIIVPSNTLFHGK